MRGILFLDLETTGLDPDSPVIEIVEIGAVLVNNRLDVVWDFHRIIRPGVSRWVWPDVVMDMHTDSGLLDALDSDEAVTPFEAFGGLKDKLEATINRQNPDSQDELPYLGGSSPHFDRRWLRSRAPHVEAQLHRRHVDTSTLRTTMRLAGVDTPDMVGSTEPHRALPDAYGALNDYRRTVDALRRSNLTSILREGLQPV